MNCTLLIVVDDHHLEELTLVYPTWLLHHPQILQMPHLLVYDRQQLRPGDPRIEWLRHRLASRAAELGVPPPEIQLHPWEMEAPTQRERQLTALVRCVRLIQTEWYLKLDTDTYSNGPGWPSDEDFQGQVLLSNPWSTTKPRTSLPQLDAWAAGHPQLQHLPSLEYQTDERCCRCRRIISWVMFGQTRWCGWASDLSVGRLPFPSQDTYLWYVAQRTGAPWRTLDFRLLGWGHQSDPDKLRRICREILEAQHGSCSPR